LANSWQSRTPLNNDSSTGTKHSSRALQSECVVQASSIVQEKAHHDSNAKNILRKEKATTLDLQLIPRAVSKSLAYDQSRRAPQNSIQQEMRNSIKTSSIFISLIFERNSAVSVIVKNVPQQC
jgi:hypothetical protein